MLTALLNPRAKADQNGFRITAWMHRNGWRKALESVEKFTRQIAEVSPMWYEIGEDFRVSPLWGYFVADTSLFSQLETREVILRPILTNANSVSKDPDRVLRMARDREARKVHIESILTIASHPLYHGLDLDYEGIRGKDLELFVDFVEELTIHLWAMEKSLSIDIEVQRDNAVLPHWKKLGALADNIRLMVYSEHTERTDPGPIASIAWSKEYLERAAQVISVHKLTYGIAVYGRLWGPKNYSATWEDLTNFSDGAEVVRDNDQIPHYEKDGSVIWFEDARSVKEKIMMAKSLNINSFAFWRLGGEDPDIWQMLKDF